MILGFFGIPYFAWTVNALLVSILFAFIWPRKAVTATTGLRYFLLRWGHSFTWLFLALSFALRGFGPELNGGSSFFALAGGVMYLLFVMMTFVVR